MASNIAEPFDPEAGTSRKKHLHIMPMTRVRTHHGNKLTANVFFGCYSYVNAYYQCVNAQDEHEFLSFEFMLGGIISVKLKALVSSSIMSYYHCNYLCKLYVETKKIEGLKISLTFSSTYLQIENSEFTTDSGKTVLVHQMQQANIPDFFFDFTLVAKLVERNDSCKSMFADKKTTDIELCGVDGSVKMHKFVIAPTSLLVQEMVVKQEIGAGKINVAGVLKTTLENLKSYLYMGKMPNKGLKELLLIARTYKMSELEYRCIEKLVNSVTAENYLDLEAFAVKNDITELRLAMMGNLQSRSISVNDIRNSVSVNNNANESADGTASGEREYYAPYRRGGWRRGRGRYPRYNQGYYRRGRRFIRNNPITITPAEPQSQTTSSHFCGIRIFMENCKIQVNQWLLSYLPNYH